MNKNGFIDELEVMHIVLNTLQYPIEYMDSLSWADIAGLADKKIEQQKEDYELYSYVVSVGVNNALNKKKITVFGKSESTSNKKMNVVEGLDKNKQQLFDEMNKRFGN